MQPAPDEAFTKGGAFTVEEQTVPGPQDAPDISLLICSPTVAAGPVPVIYHVHGGGLVMGDNRSQVPEMLDLAQGVDAAVVSVEYRLAPETPHPGPVGDCYAGLVWTAEHAQEQGFHPEQIIVAGGSAGGGLAAARLTRRTHQPGRLRSTRRPAVRDEALARPGRADFCLTRQDPLDCAATTGETPLDAYTIRVLDRQDARCVLCGEHLLSHEHLPRKDRMDGRDGGFRQLALSPASASGRAQRSTAATASMATGQGRSGARLRANVA
ncbi:alpha/beta hydrolase [Nonomuraea sp. NPDC048882]|uniref:alpha/beta hydrolase n=1 Tax=Nonomuraea sp. NPDC048882 TaxID=3154347 RepID=UPI003410727F